MFNLVSKVCIFSLRYVIIERSLTAWTPLHCGISPPKRLMFVNRPFPVVGRVGILDDDEQVVIKSYGINNRNIIMQCSCDITFSLKHDKNVKGVVKIHGKMAWVYWQFG